MHRLCCDMHNLHSEYAQEMSFNYRSEAVDYPGYSTVRGLMSNSQPCGVPPMVGTRLAWAYASAWRGVIPPKPEAFQAAMIAAMKRIMELGVIAAFVARTETA